MDLQIINPIIYTGWDELVLSHKDYSFFHTSHWARVLSESYYYNPLYFTMINNGSLEISIPMMEIISSLTGKRGVSLPFTDYCYAIMPNNMQLQNAFDFLTDYGEKAKWKYIEMRGKLGFSEAIEPSSNYYGHILDLSHHENEIFSHFKNSNKRNIRKSIKEGVEIKICNNVESVKDFYYLNCLTRKMHGLPPQPYYFFKKIFDHIISKNHGTVVLAIYKGQVIAGAVYFHFGNKAVYKYGASDWRYQYLRPNNLVMWKAIQWYCQNGYKSLCFGRTDTDHGGLMQFKNGWGAEIYDIKYYRFDVGRRTYVTAKSQVSGFHNRVFNKMPMPLLKAAGSMLYRHIG
jgi:hypothetical protein